MQNNTKKSAAKDARGFFGIGIYQCKTGENIGTLWRSAYQLGASFIFTIGKRYKQQPGDTCKSSRHIPLYNYEDWKHFKVSLPEDCQIVGVEMGGKPLSNFVHPERCIYLLGAEDKGLPKEILENIKQVVELQSVRQPSFNVAVTGSIVMYDRLAKTKE